MNPIVAMKEWAKKRRLSKMIRTAEEFGMSVVRLREVAGTTYIINNDGSFFKLSRGKK